MKNFEQTVHTGIYNYYAAYIAIFICNVNVTHPKNFKYNMHFDVMPVKNRSGDIILTIEAEAPYNNTWVLLEPDYSFEDFAANYKEVMFYMVIPSKKIESTFYGPGPKYNEDEFYSSYTAEDLKRPITKVERLPSNLSITYADVLTFIYKMTKMSKELYIERYGKEFESNWDKVVGRVYNPIESGRVQEYVAEAEKYSKEMHKHLEVIKAEADSALSTIQDEFNAKYKELKDIFDKRRSLVTDQRDHDIIKLKKEFTAKVSSIADQIKEVTGEAVIPLNGWM